MAFSTIIETIGCGVETITTPDTGKDCKAVKATSPVPGGISINKTSKSDQQTSV